jgi:hypothetical protein
MSAKKQEPTKGKKEYKAVKANFACDRGLHCDTRFEDSADAARLFYNFLVYNNSDVRLDALLKKNRYQRKMKLVKRHILLNAEL